MAEQKKYEYEIKKSDFVETTKDGVKHFTNETDHLSEIKKSIFGEEKISEFKAEVDKYNDAMKKIVVELATENIKNGEKEVVIEYKKDNTDVQTYVNKDDEDINVITKVKYDNDGPSVEEIRDEVTGLLSKL